MPVTAPNPFEENTPLDRPAPEGGNPFFDYEGEGKREPMGSDAKRRGTLEKIAGLSPFWKGGKSLLGVKGAPEKRRGRRRSEDVSLLSLGRKKEGGEEEGGGPGGGVKRLSFLWLGGSGVNSGNRSRRESMVEVVPESNEVIREAEKPREPLSVLEILQLIQRRELRSADQHIIELEAECDGELSPVGLKSPGRQAKDVTLLYEALMKEMWAVVEESLNNKGKHLKLDEVIGVIQQEEARENPHGKKNMRAHWAEAVQSSVQQRLKSNLEGKMGSLPSQADRVKRIVVEDLTSVKNYLVCSYPRDFEVFRIYLSAYHRGVADWLSAATQRDLETNDIYFILDWNSNVYCRDILSRPEISPIINPYELGPLLTSDTRTMLEQQYVSLIQHRISHRLEEELKVEQDRWMQTMRNEDLHSGFSGRIIQIMKPNIDRAPVISEGFGIMVSMSCLGCFSEFLSRFHKSVERFYIEQEGLTETTEAFIFCIISIVNCCPPFREFTSRMTQLAKGDGADLQGQAEGSLDRITALATRAISDLILLDIKPFSKKLLGRRWLNNSEACEGIVSILGERTSALRKLSPGPYHAAISELHRRIVLELVRPLIQGKMSCTTSKARRKVAAKLREESKQLGQIFSKLESPQATLDQVIPRLTEILVLEDTASIQMEVGMLVSDFPDFRKRHLSSLLDVRGLWDPSSRHQILGVLHDLEGADALPPCRSAPGFFSEIGLTRDTRCLNISLSRASQFGRRTLSRFSHRQRSTSRPSSGGLGNGEEDTQL
ncbi:exocyst complex component 3-like protein 2 [Hyla sarda]|uniref:exocyst complex component 3-like protein 2 n=1 Tax=Hyla sarda TaxID=327740 RepID=UPI0024C436E7|nr:exocyst complex component 3-like protein 2 [Hyla sarda]XP_056394347.1 exocyst complex component 3-like protein 2 [Hyla sarda]XP_056394348.1 exocyst complex component 3-like protein 2 [Hyla sarda]XP_056394349.1 exocyst complex component 3-like protein 2 [Hyla sarda]XP_056394350.1 exocyst complex component 3-like protein 2 [Hyla sarda]XP_056394351.1 exocyst complex component 3-like protein 2 [Hyla sarda]